MIWYYLGPRYIEVYFSYNSKNLTLYNQDYKLLLSATVLLSGMLGIIQNKEC